ncbi:MAG: DMT family transporter [Bacteroidales bacterium]|nr:DMT family transporter [Bacteroidales bacterium]
MKQTRTLIHILAISISVLWGTTFVSSKVLINHGLLPSQIMFLRFVLAYFCMLAIAGRRLFASSIKDEMLLAGLGLAGGSLYFMAENTALQLTQACNVAILISLTPLFTSLAAIIFYKNERITRFLVWGGLVALAGVVLVVFNGHFVLKLSLAGDILTLTASCLWVAYSIILKKLNNSGYSSAFITRKVFFYGIITILPFLFLDSAPFRFSVLTNFTVLGNLFYLGILASFIAYLSWNYVVKRLGIITSTNYLYLNPLATFITSAIVLHERITLVGLIGGAMILSGVYFSQLKS